MPRAMRALLIAGLVLAPAAGEAGPPHCPPGHAKKGWCTPGGKARLPAGEPYRVIRDFDRYRLPPPPRGRDYVIVDGEVFLILEATREVIEAVGAVDRLLNR